MYIFRLGFLDGRSGLTIALLYGLQDYVSKTKFYMQIKRNPQIRFIIQDFFIERIARIEKYGKNRINFISSYKKKVLLAE